MTDGVNNLMFCFRPYKLKTKIVISALAVLVFISALSGYLIGSADYASRRTAEPPDPIEHLKPSASRLHVFQKAAVCTDAPQCSQIGSGKQRTKKEVNEHTNHFDPSGHSRKIVTKLMNTENNKKSNQKH
uniref:Uncharacterized protein n=1 Tax=Heliothis virescens TaxID=7102 RepID=A0A2A4IRY3_HELVI